MNRVDKIEVIERDYKLFFVIFIFTNLFFFLITLVLNHFFILELLFLERIILSFVFSLIFFLFLKVTVLIKNGVLYFKNIYGFTIKKITLKDVKGKKVIYNALPSKSFLFLFGLKYDRMIEIRLDIENSKKYSINGQIFTKKGLEKFLRLIKV